MGKFYKFKKGSPEAKAFMAKIRGMRGMRGKKRRKNPNSSTRSEVRSPTSTRSEVRSPTRTSTSTKARTTGNVTVTGGAGAGATNVTLRRNPRKKLRRFTLKNPRNRWGHALKRGMIVRVTDPRSGLHSLDYIKSFPKADAFSRAYGRQVTLEGGRTVGVDDVKPEGGARAKNPRPKLSAGKKRSLAGSRAYVGRASIASKRPPSARLKSRRAKNTQAGAFPNPRDYPNIEPSGFRKGEFVGYSNGAWRVVRNGKFWRANKQGGNALRDTIFARTLDEMSRKLAARAAETKRNPRKRAAPRFMIGVSGASLDGQCFVTGRTIEGIPKVDTSTAHAKKYASMSAAKSAAQKLAAKYPSFRWSVHT